MIIQNSKRILEELSQLEGQIKTIEKLLRDVAPEYDPDELLKTILSSYSKG